MLALVLMALPLRLLLCAGVRCSGICCFWCWSRCTQMLLLMRLLVLVLVLLLVTVLVLVLVLV